ncbi:hypothetical protein LLG95_13490 [bacterium]|nr:hypothetical protein [bacterium]
MTRTGFPAGVLALALLFIAILPSRAESVRTIDFGQAVNVDISPDQSRIAFSDSTGAQVLDARTGRRLLYLSGHRDWVESVAFSSDGRRLITGGFDNVAKIWDARTGSEILSLRGHTGLVHSAIFSPDGKLALTASWDKTVRLWDAQTGELLRTFKGHKKIVEYAVFDRDAKQVLTCGYDNVAIVWDAATGRIVTRLVGHADGIQTAFFSPDGKTILTASFDKTAKLWDRASGRLIRTFSGHTQGIHSAVFSPDGSKILTASWDHTARVWDTATGALMRTIKHDDFILHAIFTPDGRRILTGSYDKTLALWDAGSGELVKRYDAGQDIALACAAGKKQIAVGLANHNAIVIDPDREYSWDATMIGHGGPVTSIACSPDGRLIATGSTDRTARVWKIRRAEPVHVLKGHAGAVRCAAFSPDGSMVATGSDDQTARVWDAQTGKQKFCLSGHAARVRSVCFSRDNLRLLTGSDDGTIRLWDLAGGKLVRAMDAGSPVQAVAFLPGGREVIVGTLENQPQIRDLANGRLVRKLPGHTGPVRSAASAPDGRTFMTASDDGSFIIWDAPAGVEVFRHKFDLPPRCAAYFPDSRAIVAVTENITSIVNIAAEVPRPILSRPEKIARLASLSTFVLLSGVAGLMLISRNGKRRRGSGVKTIISEKKRAWFRFAAVLIVCAMAWPALEMSLRVLLTFAYRGQLANEPAGPPPNERATIQLPQLLTPDPDPKIGFRLRPGAKGVFQNADVGINGMGFRDDPVDRAKSRRTLRVLGLGDSTMFGFGVHRQETYMDLLEAECNSFMGPDWKVEFINTGTPGYNTSQQAELLLARGLDLQPDAVIVQFDQNDVQTIMTLPKPEFLFSTTLLTAHLPEIFSGGGTDARAFYFLGQDDRLRHPSFPATGWTAVERSYRDMARVCRERNIPIFGLLVFEDMPPIMPVKVPLLPIHQRVVDLWREIGITPIEALPAANQYALKRQLHWIDLVNGHSDERHPNRIGHALIAQAALPPVADALAKKAGLESKQRPLGNIILRQTTMANMHPTEIARGEFVNWTRRAGHFHFVPGGGRVVVPITVGHPDVSPARPLEVTVHIYGAQSFYSPLKRRKEVFKITKPGYSEHALDIRGLVGSPLELTVIVDRTFDTEKTSEMGVGIHPLRFK